MAVHILIGFAIAVASVLSLLVRPFGRCPVCWGRRVLVSGRRARRCPACHGAGRHQRFGSRTVHRVRRQVASHWREPR